VLREITATGNSLYFVHTDHLGSVSAVTCGNSGGCPGGFVIRAVVGRQYYRPYGGPRGDTVALPTDRAFTGQVRDATGLDYFRARYFSSSLGRFISADSIVPGAGNPQAFNRYSYAYNSPLRHTDPSGHVPLPNDILSKLFGLQFTGDWRSDHRRAVVTGVIDVAVKLAEATPQNDTPIEAFRAVYGIDSNKPFTFEWDPNCPDCKPKDCADCAPQFGFTHSTRHIEFASMSADWRLDVRPLKQRNNVVHELGHAFENATEQTRANSSTYKPAREALPWTDREGLAEGGIWRQSDELTSGEIFADMFVGWTYDTWRTDARGITVRGSEYRQWMNQNMPLWVDLATGR